MSDPARGRTFVTTRTFAPPNLKAIWEQAKDGTLIEHDCPAMFACAAILAELVDCGYCGNCFGVYADCEPLWTEQRKCCPDCTHVLVNVEVPTVVPAPSAQCAKNAFCFLRDGHEGDCDDFPF